MDKARAPADVGIDNAVWNSDGGNSDVSDRDSCLDEEIESDDSDLRPANFGRDGKSIMDKYSSEVRALCVILTKRYHLQHDD
jgi:hypothetical protein